MGKESGYRETSHYRCLVYHEKQTDDIYLTSCGIEQCLSGYEFHAEQRTGYHMHVILGGKGVLSVNGTSYPLHHGQMFITKPGEQTWYRADDRDPWNYCWMTFDGDNAPHYTESAGFRPSTNWLDCHVELRQFTSLVQQILDRPEMTLSNDLLRLGSLLQFLSLAVESNDRATPSSQREREYSADVYVDYAITYIQSNYANVKISDVARFIGINRSYLTNIFKQKMGKCPQEYLMQCKLERACELLVETNAPIQVISQRIGYENPLTFSKIFKGYYGVSPKNYREQKQNAQAIGRNALYEHPI